MVAVLPTYLASLISTLKAAKAMTDSDRSWAFRLAAREHPGFEPLIRRAAERRAKQLRGRFLSEMLADDSEDHVCKQAVVQISGRGRGLELLPTATEKRNWAILHQTVQQGTTRRYEVSTVQRGLKIEAVHTTIQDALAADDQRTYLVLLVLLRRRSIRPPERGLDLAYSPRVAGDGPSALEAISLVASAWGISPRAVIDRAVARLDAALRDAPTVDRKWAKTVLDLVNRPWII